MEKRPMKDIHLGLRFDERVKKLLEKRAAKSGVSVSSIIRILVRKALSRDKAEWNVSEVDSPVKSWCYSMRIDSVMEDMLAKLSKEYTVSVAILIRNIVVHELARNEEMTI